MSLKAEKLKIPPRWPSLVGCVHIFSCLSALALQKCTNANAPLKPPSESLSESSSSPSLLSSFENIYKNMSESIYSIIIIEFHFRSICTPGTGYHELIISVFHPNTNKNILIITITQYHFSYGAPLAEPLSSYTPCLLYTSPSPRD